MANLIDGKLISTQIKDELKEEVAELKKKGIEGCLAVIQVGNDPASSVYVRNKKKACEYVGIKSLSYELAEETTEDEILKLIEKLNADASVMVFSVSFHCQSISMRTRLLMLLIPKRMLTASVHRVLERWL